MAISPDQPLGPYWDDAGQLAPSSVIQFLDPDTDIAKTVYSDLDRTIPADNPISVGSDGRLSCQVYLGVGGYKVIQWVQDDPTNLSPVLFHKNELTFNFI